MTHREPEHDRPPLWVRRSRSRPYEVAVLLILVVLAVSVGLHRRLGHPATPAPVAVGWPQR
jgi:hypothetical protein